MSFFKSLGHFFKHAAHLLFRAGEIALQEEPAVVAALQAAGAGHFLSKPLEAQALIVSIVGDVIDAVESKGKGAGPAGAFTLGQDVAAKAEQLIALVKAHPEAPK